MSYIDQTSYPDMAIIKQKLYSSEISDVSMAVKHALSLLPVDQLSIPGETVAIAVGSRGINKIDKVLYHCIEFLKSKGLKPFIVPAMGSHGGATPEGQRKVLEKFGISEESMNVPIESDMSSICIGKLSNGTNIFFSQKALGADHIVVINRVKPHTKFRADIESGLCKMLTIGLGKDKGAAEFHREAVVHSFKILEEAADFILKSTKKILFGIALLEDGNGKLSKIEGLLPQSLIDNEKLLLIEARNMMGRIPFDNLDILVIDFIGKDISGIGMDSNITGRHRDIVGNFYHSPHAKRIFVRDLSPKTDGNGNGIGLADITTKRLVDALNLEKTYVNALTAISPEKAAIPIYFNTDKKCLDVCASTIGLTSLHKARIVRIKNTASLEKLQVSNALAKDLSVNSDVEQISPWTPLHFDENDNLSSF